MSSGGPSHESETSPAARTSLPEQIGHYRIVGKLGEGAMGIVLEAEQQSPGAASP